MPRGGLTLVSAEPLAPGERALIKAEISDLEEMVASARRSLRRASLFAATCVVAPAALGVGRFLTWPNFNYEPGWPGFVLFLFFFYVLVLGGPILFVVWKRWRRYAKLCQETRDKRDNLESRLAAGMVDRG